MWKYLILVLLSYFTFIHEGRVLPGDSEMISKEEDSGRQLVYLQILSSNGHYAPLSLYPNDENAEDDWQEGVGSLTQLGKLQQYELGKFLRKFYGSFITSDPGEVDAFSSKEDRSTVSLLSLMASLYAPTEEWQFFPGFLWQPMTMCFLEDDVVDPFFGYDDYCESQLEEKKRVFSSKPIQELFKKDESLYSYWANNSGLPIENFRDVADLYDTLQKEDQSGLKVPFWARLHFDDMKRISDSAYRWTYNSTNSLQLKIGLLVDFLRIRMQVHHMEENPTPNVKVSVYMTHDWNLATVLSSMRLFNGLRPPPCATIAFELYRQRREDDHDTFDYSVRTLFFNSSHPELGRQEPHLLTLEGCSSEYCPLSDFIGFFDYVVPENHTAMCEILLDDTVDYDEDMEGSNIYPMYYDMLELTETNYL